MKRTASVRQLVKLLVLVCVVIVVILLIGFSRIKRGTYFTSILSNRDIIDKIVVEKTIETSDKVESHSVVGLTNTQQLDFFQRINDGLFYRFTSSTFSSNSIIRYKVIAYNERGTPIVEIKVYDGEIFIFDYAPGKSPPIHSKFRSINGEWASVFELYFLDSV